jgi:hypothetical protein
MSAKEILEAVMTFVPYAVLLGHSVKSGHPSQAIWFCQFYFHFQLHFVFTYSRVQNVFPMVDYFSAVQWRIRQCRGRWIDSGSGAGEDFDSRRRAKLSVVGDELAAHVGPGGEASGTHADAWVL